MNRAERDRVVAFLAEASPKVVAEVLLEAAEQRGGGEDMGEEKLVLAIVAGDDRQNAELVASHDPAAYPDGWADDAPLTQTGDCPGCGAPLRGWAKRSLCPRCGEPVPLT